MKVAQMMIYGLLFSLSASYTTIALFSSGLTFTSDELFKQFVIAIILGPVIGLGSFIFYIERLTFSLQLLLHYLFVTVSVIVAGHFGGWYSENSFLSIGKLLFIQAIIYLIVWLILNVVVRREISQINEKIKRRLDNRQ